MVLIASFTDRLQLERLYLNHLTTFCFWHGQQSLLYHTEVDWLSMGNMLTKLYNLKSEVEIFLLSSNKKICTISLQMIHSAEPNFSSLPRLNDLLDDTQNLPLNFKIEIKNLISAHLLARDPLNIKVDILPYYLQEQAIDLKYDL
ncbi:hypothetical protein PR048_008620 [Dryococelus australis]|uniref:Uncharacterized protein n=1 Tax=Dryococelus australis TaxID=614101 RepID=A0ABQ9HXM5_9NEOP|nr:hypothetical protein PR048_008620 [Dryococelus australis]